MRLKWLGKYVTRKSPLHFNSFQFPYLLSQFLRILNDQQLIASPADKKFWTLVTKPKRTLWTTQYKVIGEQKLSYQNNNWLHHWNLHEIVN